jgi:hypothetical protein
VLRELATLPVNVIVKPHAMLLNPGAVSGFDWKHALLQAETAQVKVDFAPEDVDALHAADVLITGLCEGSTVANSLAALIAHVQDALLRPGTHSDARRRVAAALFSNPGNSTRDVAGIMYQEIGLDVERASRSQMRDANPSTPR